MFELKYVSRICGLNFEIVAVTTTMYQIFLIHIEFQSSDRVELDFSGSAIKIALNFKSRGTEKSNFPPRDLQLSNFGK